ncbi:MAG TPA: TIGR01777 family oxidoreductase [Candidatus Dormibacteraeota bacterium]|jgi:uncharacterized protein (TIGR01777 family)
MKVIITGGSGYIGRNLARSLAHDGHDVVALSRGARTATPQPGVRFVEWDARTLRGGWAKEVKGAGGIVNLAGAGIGSGRWTKRRMAAILSSRLDATGAIVQAIEQTAPADRPAVLVNASGIDYYGDRGDDLLTEDSPPGTSFLARVSVDWEAAAEKVKALGTRVVLVRTALVVGHGAPAFKLMVLPFRLFAGGPLGSGRQWFTWIQIDDLVAIYRLALENPAVTGPVNAVAPDIRPQRQVAREIGRVMHRPALMPAPALLLDLAIGDQSQLLLHGRRATPRKLETLGYHFRLGNLPDALRESLKVS